MVFNEMVKTNAFNLIIVIVNIGVPIHMVQQVAFSYYSRIIHALQGHHNNGIFVYTHVEYKCRHHTNTGHHEAMDRAHRAFAYLFRKGAESSEGGVFNLATAMEKIDDAERGGGDQACSGHGFEQENLGQIWAIQQLDKENYEKCQEQKAKKEEEKSRQRQQTEVEAHNESGTLLISVEDELTVRSLELQIVDSVESDLPESVDFDSDNDADSCGDDE
ncbi:hypothetical protein BG000_008306 [Podila horticola]|nr:hypothetical protein BG000_008306 [Podila horticola]